MEAKSSVSKRKLASFLFIVLLMSALITNAGRLRQLFDIWFRVTNLSPDAEIHVIGGEDSQQAAWPWVASLQFLDEHDQSYYHVCGATLITEEWILTAAHCVDGVVQNDPNRGDAAHYRVMLGERNLYVPDQSTVQFISVRSIVMHNGWTPEPKEGFPHDIALMRLSAKADVSGAHVEPLELLSDPQHDLVNSECWIVGWGLTDPSEKYYTEILQQGNTPVVSNDDCQLDMPLPVLDSTICVGGTQFPRACEGDSGSPLACRHGDGWLLAGVGSWSRVDCSSYSIHTRVTDYLQWIRDVIVAYRR